MLVIFVKGVDTIWEKEALVKEPTIESATFVGIAQDEFVHVGEIVEEHG